MPETSRIAGGSRESTPRPSLPAPPLQLGAEQRPPSAQWSLSTTAGDKDVAAQALVE